MTFTFLFDIFIFLGTISLILSVKTSPNIPLQSTELNPKCLICNNWKPPRSEHCHLCNKCILTMDHHCLWIGNCIGVHNFRYFCLISLYIGFAAIIYTFEFFYIFAIDNSKLYDKPFYVYYLGTGIIYCPITISLIYMLFHNFINLIMNSTSLEQNIEEGRCKCFKKFYNIYDLGWVYNVERVFSKGCIIWWFIPCYNSNVKALLYETIPSVSQKNIKKKLKNVNEYLKEVKDKYKISNLDYSELKNLNHHIP